VKDILDKRQKALSEASDTPDSESHLQSIPQGPLRTAFRVATLLSNLPMDEEQRRKLLLKRSLIIFSTFFKETRPQRVSFLLGPTNASNHIYMRSGLETKWRQLADRRGGRQPAREEVYWRTLMGNARQDKSGAVDRPPEEWRDAFHRWREVLWKQEGVLPRVLRGKRPKLRKGVPTLAGTLPMRGKELNSTPVPEHLEDILSRNI